MMVTEPNELNRARVVEAAQAVLDGRVGIIEGARRLNDLRGRLEIDQLDEDFVGFAAIDSETDTLPIGDTRRLWNEDVLADKDREVEEAERLYRDGVLDGCRKLVARFGAPTSPRESNREHRVEAAAGDRRR